MKMKKMRNWLIPLGLATSTTIPLAVAVSCGDNQTVNIAASSRSDEDIAKDLSSWSKDATVVGLLSPIKNITVDQVKTYWNKPEGESIRVAAITTILGKLWNKSSNDVITAIVNGVTKAKDSAADSDGYINEYKVYLLNNIRNFLSKNKINNSMQKFDGFLNWFVDSSNNYANLKQVLMGGAINDTFIVGVQDSLNDGVVDDKKVFVIPQTSTANSSVSSGGANQGSQGPSATNQPNNQPASQPANQPTQTDVVTPVIASNFVKKPMSQPDVDNWVSAQYQLLKPLIDGTPWTHAFVPDEATFKKYLLSTDENEQLQEVPGIDGTTGRTAADIGETLRTYLVKATIGSIWGVNASDSVDNIITIAMSSFGIGAMKMQNAIADKEKQYIGSFAEYASFLDWMIDPQEHYSNLRTLCQSPTDLLMMQFQNGFKKYNTDSSKANVDIFA